jgi:bifunctional enzyme CysN/CysC
MRDLVPNTGIAEQANSWVERKKLLRFVICGSVGGGKSSLIGRLLSDCSAPAALAGDSTHPGSTGDDGDVAFSTIDIGNRYFATPRRAFIVANAPGHQQYTRNLVSGASAADVAVLVIDACNGVLPQTRRHSHIVTLLGIRHAVVVVNKMDMIGWDRTAFERIRSEYLAFAAGLGAMNVTCIPTSALHGDNVARHSSAMPWFEGPTLIEHLETVEVSSEAAIKPFRLRVQWANPSNSQVRSCSGIIVSGRVRPGDRLAVLPGGKPVEVARIATFEGDLTEGIAGQVVTLELAQEGDVSRGDVLAAADARPTVAEQFSAHLIWMSGQPMLPGRSYMLQAGPVVVGAQITALKYKLSVATFEHVAATHLELNEIAFCNVALDRAIAFDPYTENRETGAFILIDRLSNATVACGMIAFALRRSANIHWQSLKIDKDARAALKVQKPCALWLTGLSAAGKSTIADLVEQSLHRAGHHTILLDGDNIRHGLNRDLGFTDEDRVENIRRVAEVARLMVEAGLIVIVSFISPFRSERRMARGLFGEGEFIEIYVNTPIEVCEARDPKGLYKLARAGKLPNLTGIGSPYEPPEHAELVLAAGRQEPQVLAEKVLATLRQGGII